MRAGEDADDTVSEPAAEHADADEGATAQLTPIDDGADTENATGKKPSARVR